MGSKGRMPPPYMRHPPPGPGMGPTDPFGPGLHPPPGGVPLDMLPEILEQKVAQQHAEMERLLTENRRLAATHGTLRQQLAVTEQDKQMIEARVGALKSEREQEMSMLREKISKMETELRAAESRKKELQQAHSEAQGLVATRQELLSKAHQLDQDLQKAHAELPQVPGLMSQLDALRQEYQHCRAVYESEKKLYNDHLESLQFMEKNYNSMAREVEKLQAELNATPAADRRAGSGYGGVAGYGEDSASAHHSLGKTTYEDGYAGLQGRGHTSAVAGGAVAPAGGTSAAQTYGGHQPAQAPSRPGYDYQRPPAYDPQRVPAYEPQRAPYYDLQGGYGAAGYSMQRQPPYDAPPPGPAPGQMPYGSVTPPARAGAGYEAQMRGGNTGRR